jgi:hypothetical protein
MNGINTSNYKPWKRKISKIVHCSVILFNEFCLSLNLERLGNCGVKHLHSPLFLFWLNMFSFFFLYMTWNVKTFWLSRKQFILFTKLRTYSSLQPATCNEDGQDHFPACLQPYGGGCTVIWAAVVWVWLPLGHGEDASHQQDNIVVLQVQQTLMTQNSEHYFSFFFH